MVLNANLLHMDMIFSRLNLCKQLWFFNLMWVNDQHKVLKVLVDQSRTGKPLTLSLTSLWHHRKNGHGHWHICCSLLWTTIMVCKWKAPTRCGRGHKQIHHYWEEDIYGNRLIHNMNEFPIKIGTKYSFSKRRITFLGLWFLFFLKQPWRMS